MTALAADLAAESADLRRMLAGLDEAGWRRATPAPGWTVADQVTHLAYFDASAVRSATDPDAFRAELERLLADGGLDTDVIAARNRSMTAVEVLAWFDAARAELVAVFGALDAGVRVPWFGPPMSAASSLTARIMETWAHGQDVADTLGVHREPTDRLRHVAHIGVGARPFSYLANGREAPSEPVRVELVAPACAASMLGPASDPSVWTWGPEDATGRVAGPALDFCLAVTQRRHPDDTALEVTGPAAVEWMALAQAFAGPPGAGREPGQFDSSS